MGGRVEVEDAMAEGCSWSSQAHDILGAGYVLGQGTGQDGGTGGLGASTGLSQAGKGARCLLLPGLRLLIVKLCSRGVRAQA